MRVHYITFSVIVVVTAPSGRFAAWPAPCSASAAKSFPKSSTMPGPAVNALAIAPKAKSSPVAVTPCRNDLRGASEEQSGFSPAVSDERGVKAPYKKPLSSEALDSTPAHTLKGRGRECANTLCPRDGLHSALLDNVLFRPVRGASSYRQTHLIKQTSDQISQQSANGVDQNRPEQLHHRHHLLSERSPRPYIRRIALTWQRLSPVRKIPEVSQTSGLYFTLSYGDYSTIALLMTMGSTGTS